MGMTLEFIVGVEDKIYESMKEFDLDLLDDAVQHRADFSLHLTPNDLNTLSLAASIFNKQDPISLRPYLLVILDTEDYGLLAVDNDWVRYFAKMDRTDLESLTNEWCSEMQKQYPYEKLEVTADSIKAVQELWNLCNFTLNEK